MRIEIIVPDGDLQRKVWAFEAISDWVTEPRIYLDSYKFETKDTPRKRKWEVESWWERLGYQNNHIEKPAVPSDVEASVRSELVKIIYSIPIA